MSFQWNKLTQKLFWWRNTNIDIGTLSNLGENNTERKLNLSILNTQTNLKKLYDEISVLKNFYLSQMMISRIIDDALNPTADDDEIFKVTILDDDGKVNEVATRIAKNFKNEFNLERLITDIAPDLLAYGSYYLRLDINTYNSENVLKGIINIHDDVDPSTIIPVWRDNEIIYYNEIKDNKIIKKQPFEYVFFGFGTERIKVEMELNDDEAVYFRVGTGLLKPVLDLLRVLYLLEGLVYISLIKRVSKQAIIKVSVPDSISPDKALEVAKSYEKLINNNLNGVNIDFSNIKQTLEEILENTSKVKVIPDWSDKGQLEKQELNEVGDLEDIFTKIEDLRNLVLQTNGYPISLFENDSAQRIDLIQNNVRYSKKLKTFQRAIINGLTHLFMIHLKNQNFDVSSKNIKIQFSNVINLSDLEKIEYLSMVIDTMSNVKDFIDEIADSSEDTGVNVNKKALIKFYNKAFKKLFPDEEIFTFTEDSKDKDEK